MNSDEIRSAFLKFFEEKGHKVVPSSSLIPKDNPTLLLTTAGMVQIIPYFLGREEPPNRRLASCQKCFRTTDIEEVGDDRHNTFFEMLGNFSVGDYFKKEAIAWAWEFFTKRMKLDPAKLWATVYLDDDEAFELWKAYVPENKIVRCDEKDNFWGPVGGSGPCGPCSEIHYDFGAEKGCGKPDCKPNCECGRFKEIWNLVFAQYNQDETGKRTPLPRKNIDTGMGLERIVMIMAGEDNIYATDIFASLIEKAAALSGKKYGVNPDDDTAIRAVAEHGRALAFLIADGVLPDNEGRGYVLRRLLRRAQYFSGTLTTEKSLLSEIAKAAIAKMKHIYPELEKNKIHIIKVIESEVDRFQRVILTGKSILNNTLIKMREELRDYFPTFEASFQQALSHNDVIDLQTKINNAIQHFLRDCQTFERILSIGGKQILEDILKPVNDSLEALNQQNRDYKITDPKPLSKQKQNLQMKFYNVKSEVDIFVKKITGLELFVLHDTYGFPVELTKEIVSKSGFTVDMAGFEAEMDKQRERARASHKFDVAISGQGAAKLDVKGTEFVGYQCLDQKARILKFLVDSQVADAVSAGQEAGIVLSASPFYGEMGGQVGDMGEIIGSGGKFSVTDTVRLPPDIIIHQGRVVEGSFKVGEEVKAIVGVDRRKDIARNHTATHLLQAALRQVLGGHIQQRGSLVAPERLRFDFSHLAAMTPEEIKAVQSIVNEMIRRNLKVTGEEMDYKKAVASGATALFDEKYGDVVRVLKIGQPTVSMELCGGTHIENTGEIGYFHILSEGSIGAGLRRIEAVTGREAEKYIGQRFSGLEDVARMLETPPEKVREKVTALLEELETQKRHALSLERELGRNEAQSLLAGAREIKGINVIAARISSDSQQVLREMADYLRDSLKSGIVVLGAVSNDRPVFIAAVTPDLVAKGYNAGNIVREVSKAAGGGGGGKPNFAQAGGKDINKLDEALDAVEKIIGQR